MKRGLGKTISLTSKEIIFETDQDLEPGSELDASIAWPVALDQEIGLQLAACLVVKDRIGRQITAALHNYQFRTRRQSAGVRAVASSAGFQVYAGAGQSS